jgi:sulfur-carrier protein adenylyltransferase/sulfurtransferase
MSWSSARSKGTNLISSLFGIREIGIDEVMRKLNNGEHFCFIDTRDESSWERGHVKGAEHMPDSTIRLAIKEKIPDYETEIVLYCDIGICSLFTTEKLRKLGYRNVYSMAGGYYAWKKAEYPVIIEED